jgi:capsular polysaccharide transport system permease protein
MLNPLAHGVELVRMGLSDNYQAVPETDAGYLFAWVLGLLLLGLALQLRLSPGAR